MSGDAGLREEVRLDALTSASRAVGAARFVSVVVLISGVLLIGLGFYTFTTGEDGDAAPFAIGLSAIVAGVTSIAYGLMVSQGIAAIGHYVMFRTLSETQDH